MLLLVFKAAQMPDTHLNLKAKNMYYALSLQEFSNMDKLISLVTVLFSTLFYSKKRLNLLKKAESRSKKF